MARASDVAYIAKCMTDAGLPEPRVDGLNLFWRYYSKSCGSDWISPIGFEPGRILQIMMSPIPGLEEAYKALRGGDDQ